MWLTLLKGTEPGILAKDDPVKDGPVSMIRGTVLTCVKIQRIIVLDIKVLKCGMDL